MKSWVFAGPVLAACLGGPAPAQEVRNLDRQVARGAEMEFQWLNMDEAACRDNGPAQLVITRPPRLGRFRTAIRAFTARTGPCAGGRFSTLLVYYRAGAVPGLDETSYTVVGTRQIVVNLRFTVF